MDFMGKFQMAVLDAKYCINCDDEPEMQVPSSMAAALSDDGR
jgi:hypothetical protein